MSKGRHRAKAPRWPKLTAGTLLAVGFVALLPMSAQARTQQSESHTSAPAVAPATGTFGMAPAALGRKAVLSPAWVAPLASWRRVSSCYGWRDAIWRDGVLISKAKVHTGIDLAAPYGRAVRSVTAGTVTRSGWRDGDGYTVEVAHAGGVGSFYGHMSRLAVRVGAKVGTGRTLGYVGSTGASTGNHLHFELRHGGTPFNPAPYLADRGVKVGC